MGRYFYEAMIYPSNGKMEVQIPDFGLFTFGDDLADAAFMAQDALELEISSRLVKGEKVSEVGNFGHDCPEGGTLMGIVISIEEAAMA